MYRLPEHSTGLAGLAAALTAQAVDQSLDRDAVEVTVFAVGGHRAAGGNAAGGLPNGDAGPVHVPPSSTALPLRRLTHPEANVDPQRAALGRHDRGPCPAALHSSE